MKLLGLVYKIVFHQNKREVYPESEDAIAVGLTRYEKKEIHLWRPQTTVVGELDEQELQLTFIHEVVHAIYHELSISEPIEEDVCRLALGWVSFFRENNIKVPIK